MTESFLQGAIFFAFFMAVFPYAVVGTERRRYVLIDVFSYAAALAVWKLAPLVGLGIEPSLAFSLFVIGKAAFFLFFCAAVETDTMSIWTPRRAAIFAAGLYLALIPRMLATTLDGDEPYYLLVTESIVRDGDLDLSNQYRNLNESTSGRTDLRAHAGDPRDAQGRVFSRQEPLLSILLVPGYMIGRLAGVLGTLALLGALLIGSIVALMGEEGIFRRTRAFLIPLVTLGPPLISYSVRIWPEVPAALLFSEALRAARRDNVPRLIGSLLLLSLLKIRFAAVAVPLLLLYFLGRKVRPARMIAAVAILLIPFALTWLIAGDPLNVHSWWELGAQPLIRYPKGFFGLMLDGQGGLLFQAPAFFLALFALFSWRSLSPVFRIGCLAAVPYLVLLFPRTEWHGGWSPPLRYLVVFVPLLAVGTAFVFDRVSSLALRSVIAISTVALSVYAVAHPSTLFHLPNGETLFSEALSGRFQADFSRLVPSFIRVNHAAVISAVLLILFGIALSFLLRTSRKQNALSDGRFDGTAIAALAMALALLFVMGRKSASVVHFEDSHVTHTGGELHPHPWTPLRFMFLGGWLMRPGDSLGCLYATAPSELSFATTGPAVIEINGRRIELGVTGGRFRSQRVELDAGGRRITVRCLSGSAVLDRIRHE